MTSIKKNIQKVCQSMYDLLDNARYGKRRVGIMASGGKDSLFMMDICLPILDELGVEYGERMCEIF